MGVIVNTNEKYRNLGYGKKVVAKTSNFVIDNGLLSIYFVNVKNQASINLAKSLEFNHPITGEKMHLEADLPEYFKNVLQICNNRK